MKGDTFYEASFGVSVLQFPGCTWRIFAKDWRISIVEMENEMILRLGYTTPESLIAGTNTKLILPIKRVIPTLQTFFSGKLIYHIHVYYQRDLYSFILAEIRLNSWYEESSIILQSFDPKSGGSSRFQQHLEGVSSWRPMFFCCSCRNKMNRWGISKVQGAPIISSAKANCLDPTWDGHLKLLLMAEILHQFIGPVSFSHYL